MTRRPQPSVPSDHSVGMVLRRAEQSLMRAKSAAIKPSGLTLSHYVTLAALESRPGITAAALARACLVTPQAMTVALAAMDERGLITRFPHPRHPTVVEVHPTDVGRDALRAAREGAEPVEQRVRDEFSAQELGSLRSMLVRLADAVEQPGTASPHG